jgi:glucosamine--fructose-6-phosphate aminotransferase (isomerizing)
MKPTFETKLAKIVRALFAFSRGVYRRVASYLSADVYFGRTIAAVPPGALVFFPYRDTVLCCGIAGIVSYKKKRSIPPVDITELDQRVSRIARQGGEFFGTDQDKALDEGYLGGAAEIDSLWQAAQTLKCEQPFFAIFTQADSQMHLKHLARRLSDFVDGEAKRLADRMGQIPAQKVELMAARIEKLKDIVWCLRAEVLANIEKINTLCAGVAKPLTLPTVSAFKKINAVLNSIDRLEVRGRDSAGISLLFVFEPLEFEAFEKSLERAGIADRLKKRSQQGTLVDGAISIHKSGRDADTERIAIAFTYKVAIEVGSLGDNTNLLRRKIASDPVLQTLAPRKPEFDTVSAHTRWASVGAITEANCHPVDNQTIGASAQKCGIIHTCLNGDIDNYQKLKSEFEDRGISIPKDITTDTKIIPLQIQKYVQQGHDVEEAFRRAVNDFEGSHAISMHTDLAPGKIFLAQKGSGQAVFIGLAEDHSIPTSEVYGFVEETQSYLKLDGETVMEGKDGPTQGQIFILSQNARPGPEGIRAMSYDGTPLSLSARDIKHTDITSRDIDRQGYPHYFFKEISESPVSVEKTLQNRWKIKDDQRGRYVITLAETVIPESMRRALVGDQIKRIFFIGQGTAGVAALACANILNYYIDNPAYPVSALKASEFSGFQLNERDGADSMNDALVIAISQSGTTTDTNRTVDMVKERGAHTLAIVNRRDSDLTFKVDGVMYTSSGRDIEMSVASTKAFYSQIVAGAVLGLYIASVKKRRDAEFVAREIKQLLALPSHMRKILAMSAEIGASAAKLAVTKTYWAAVGSGPNKASADEIRIKLSELCYKTISSDYVEDKKHIDLSSEPLIIICAAGTRNTVIGDIIKDTAIFKAHKATPIVITDEGEDRFDPYADAVFRLPRASEHLAPVLNTLVGHIWGYYAALAIHEGSRFLYGIQEELRNTVDEFASRGLNVYEIILENPFREKIARFYTEFKKKRAEKKFPLTVGFDAVSDLTLLFKYLAGRLPVSDFEIDFNQKGTAVNMLTTLFKCLGESISYMARPVDAIKHQAKTVTVGTSRISERVEGILFDVLTSENINISQLTNTNIIVLKNLQGIIAEIEGSVLYRIAGLNLLGEPVEGTTIEVVKKRGIIAGIPSRVETDPVLKGTKRIIVSQGNVYIGKGRKDERSILVVPILTLSAKTPNQIEYLLLLHIAFKSEVPLDAKIKALGGKYEHIKSIVQENSMAWNDQFLELIEIQELFGRSAEKVGESIVSLRNSQVAML